jgi:hypothetical protein
MIDQFFESEIVSNSAAQAAEAILSPDSKSDFSGRKICHVEQMSCRRICGFTWGNFSPEGTEDDSQG